MSTDLSDVNRKKLRSSVYESLMGKDIQEKSPLFRPCFTKLFSIVKMYVIDQQNNEPSQCTKKWMFELCKNSVDSVVNMEKLLGKKKR